MEKAKYIEKKKTQRKTQTVNKYVCIKTFAENEVNATEVKLERRRERERERERETMQPQNVCFTAPSVNVPKPFFSSPTVGQNKLECSPLTTFSG